MRIEFDHYAVNAEGKAKLLAVGEGFSRLLDELEQVVPPGRERSLVVTKLQEAKMWATRGVAAHGPNQEPPK